MVMKRSVVLFALLPLIIKVPDGTFELIEVRDDERFVDVIHLLENSYPSTDGYMICSTAYQEGNEGQAGVRRDYNHNVSEREKRDISLIINTIGLESPVKVVSMSSVLKKAKERVIHIHPLKFLACIFTDEQMKAAMHALKARSWLFQEFMSGLKGSLDQELASDNLMAYQIDDFARLVGIDANQIYPHYENRYWEGLVHTLIAKIPRKNNPNRYNM